MMMWKQFWVQKWDAHNTDDKVSGEGITHMVAKVMKEVAPGQEVRENLRVKAAKMDSEGLEALQHADRLQKGGQEKCQ
jgi:hypothetical protein